MLHRPRLALARRFLFLVGVLVPSLDVPARAESESADAARAELYETRVRPALDAHCAKCHGPSRAKGGLRLDSPAGILAGSDSGPVVAAGDPDASPLIRAIRYDSDLRMPPSGRLPDDVIRDLEEWVRTGASLPGVERATHAPEPPSRPGASSESEPEWWSLRPIVRPEPPPSSDAERGEIDRFLDAALREAGLAAAPRADPRTLVRRLSLDVRGLPPSPEEARDFAAASAAGADASDEAWAALVDRYLDSREYAERWARHWLDVVRFAETNGFETNTPRPRAWPFRDYVIESLAADKPFDRFVMEQLAGDALGEPVATGFLVGGPWDEVKSPDLELTLNQRANELHDMVSTAGGAFLGATVGCARCHDHKFDPIRQTDYYAMIATLAGVNHGEREIESPRDAGRPRELARVEAVRAEIDARLLRFEPLAEPFSRERRRAPVDAARVVERFPPVEATGVRFTVLKTNSAEPCIDELEVLRAASGEGGGPVNVARAAPGVVVEASGSYGPSDIHKLEFVNDGAYGNERSWISNENGGGRVTIRWPSPEVVDAIVWARDRHGRFKDRLATRYTIELETPDGKWRVVASSADRAPHESDVAPDARAQPLPPGAPRIDPAAGDAMQWLDLRLLAAHLDRKAAGLREATRVYAGTFSEPEPTRLLARGDPMQPGEAVAPGGIAAIAPSFSLPPDTPERERRLALARWIVAPDNPLTARVIVNRVWHYHFGEGIVATPSDFGRMGARPSHPELLDWLAADFVEGGWSLKRLHRKILLSEAYRRSSRPVAESLARDAGSRLLWRFPPRRLEAEALRDSILSVSGSLVPSGGGPGFDLFEPNTNYVRVYVPKRSFGPAEFRRMVYQTKPRNVPDETFGAFDCPDGAQPQPRRNASTTPLQALNLLNSPFMLDQAERFARRVESEVSNARDASARHDGSSDAGGTSRATTAFELALGRPPNDEELAASTALAREHGIEVLCRALLNAGEFLRIE